MDAAKSAAYEIDYHPSEEYPTQRFPDIKVENKRNPKNQKYWED
jgi:hypothetical protein